MSWRLPIAPRLALATSVAALVAVAPGWSNSTWASAPTVQTRYHSAHPPKHGPLSGTWLGSYSGAFSGTFTLTWQQSGQNLSGTIKVSGLNDVPTSINGTVQGAFIRFGTVGSKSITYAGSVSGNSMSGTWKMKAGGRSLGGGSWHASKSSRTTGTYHSGDFSLSVGWVCLYLATRPTRVRLSPCRCWWRRWVDDVGPTLRAGRHRPRYRWL